MGDDDKRSDEVPEHVGQRMRKWRRASGKSLETVAKAVGLSKGHLSNVERGIGNMSLPAFIRYCRAVNAPSSRILEEKLIQRHKDVDRIAADVVGNSSLAELRWLSELSKAELRDALQAAHDRIDLRRARERDRVERKRAKQVH